MLVVLYVHLQSDLPAWVLVAMLIGDGVEVAGKMDLYIQDSPD